jgi:hypothetical protein
LNDKGQDIRRPFAAVLTSPFPAYQIREQPWIRAAAFSTTLRAKNWSRSRISRAGPRTLGRIPGNLRLDQQIALQRFSII